MAEKYEVNIAGRKYTIVSDENEEKEFIERVANVVDGMIVSFRNKNKLLSKEDAAVLVAVNAVAEKLGIQDPESISAENETLREEVRELQNKYDALEKKFNKSKTEMQESRADEKSLIELQDSLKNSQDLNIDLRGAIEEKDRELAEIEEERKDLEERLLASETKLLFAEKELREKKD